MKKKKLKKRIKELEDQLVGMYDAQGKILSNLRDRISALDDVITNKHNSYKSEFGTLKANKREIENEICSLKKQVDILKRRTETDYTQFKPLVDTSKGPEDAPPTCETCRYNGSDVLGPDGPCFGCTKEDKKMYKPITHTEEPNGN